MEILVIGGILFVAVVALFVVSAYGKKANSRELSLLHTLFTERELAVIVVAGTAYQAGVLAMIQAVLQTDISLETAPVSIRTARELRLWMSRDLRPDTEVLILPESVYMAAKDILRPTIVVLLEDTIDARERPERRDALRTLLESVPKTGLIITPLAVTTWLDVPQITEARVRTIGIDEPAHAWATLQHVERRSLTYTLHDKHQQHSVTLPLSGGVTNILPHLATYVLQTHFGFRINRTDSGMLLFTTLTERESILPVAFGLNHSLCIDAHGMLSTIELLSAFDFLANFTNKQRITVIDMTAIRGLYGNESMQHIADAIAQSSQECLIIGSSKDPRIESLIEYCVGSGMQPERVHRATEQEVRTYSIHTVSPNHALLLVGIQKKSLRQFFLEDYSV